MSVAIRWPRFLVVSIVSAIVMLALYALWGQSHIVAGLSAGYPSRPPAEVKPLVPFLFAASLTQLVVFCYLYLRAYPRRSLTNAVWWGAWGGFFMVLPDGQFFVETPNERWRLLAMQWSEGIVTAMLLMALFQLVYRPKDEGWLPVGTDWPRFLIMGALSAVLVFVLDLAFHLHLASLLFDDYPAHDFPRRGPIGPGLLGWLFLTYLSQVSLFCYLFLRVYPRRGMGNAIWFGAWLGIWVVIPNMQFFVGLDKYTWHMLSIQVLEGAILTMVMMAFFEWGYRPKFVP